DLGAGVGIKRHMNVFLFRSRTRMTKMEIERERVEKLKLLVVLNQMLFFDPSPGGRIALELRLEAFLARTLSVQHFVGRLGKLRKDGNRHRSARPNTEFRKTIAGMIESPAVHR